MMRNFSGVVHVSFCMDRKEAMTEKATRIHHRAVLGTGFAALVLGLTACGSVDETPTSAADRARTLSPALEATPEPAPATAAEPVSPGALDVSGAGVEAVPFGTGVDDAMAMLTGRLGEPDAALDPERYSRIEGQDGWYELPGDSISLSWQYRVVSVSCWGGFCAIFGGEAPGSLVLRGWEFGVVNRWHSSPAPGDSGQPDVRLEGTGMTLGDNWKQLRAAYPGVVSGGAEGGTLGVRNMPWPAIFDGAAEWRLSGYWDYRHPSKVPADSVITRLSGGEGPEPGCC